MTGLTARVRLAAAATLAAGLVLTAWASASAGVVGHPRGSTAVTGALQAWGSNRAGDLGNGTFANSNVPVPVTLPAGTKVVMARAGRDHSLALTTTGHVLAWGGNRLGQLGDGTTANRNVPVAVKLSPSTRVKAVRAGCKDSLALTSAGGVLAWGNNEFGELGNGTRRSSAVPVSVRLPSGIRVKAISAGCFFNLALTTTGQVLAWGRNYSGSLGNGSLSTGSLLPVRVRLPAGVTATAISAGGYFGLAIASTGQLYGWGYNAAYEVGDGTKVNRDVPVKVALAPRSRFGIVTELACGNVHALALTSKGIVLGWGLNDVGQVGVGGSRFVQRPTRITLPGGARAVGIGAGFDNGMALTSDGAELAWGYNAQGQLGNGSFSPSGVASPVLFAAGVVASALGAGPESNHSFAIVRPR